LKIDLASARACALLVCALTSACGGGGSGASGGVASTPPPPLSYASVDHPTTNLNLKTITSAFTYTDTNSKSGTVRTDVKRDLIGDFGSGSVLIDYDATKQSYTVTDKGVATVYSSTDGSHSQDYNSDAYYHVDGNKSEEGFIISRQYGSYPTAKSLTYSAFISKNRHDINLNSENNTVYKGRLSISIGGVETVASDMPKTGTASYAGISTGYLFDSPQITLSVSSTLSVDFSSRSVSTSMSLRGEPSQSLGMFTGTAPIDQTGIHFKGDLNADGVAKGTFSGGFFGPQAIEAGYIFRVATNVGIVDGAVLGRKN
jgi:hypothetical protein